MGGWRPAAGLALSLLLALLGLGGVASLVKGARLHAPTQIAPNPGVSTTPPDTISPGAAPAAHEGQGLRLISSDERGVVLELLTPALQTVQESADGKRCSRLVVEGYGQTEAAGHPALPVKGALLGIPPGVTLTLTVLGVDATPLPGRYDLCPVPSPIIDEKPAGEVRYGGVARVRNARAYATDVLSPTSPAELVSTGMVRSQRVAQLRFHPFQYNPVTGELRHNRRIRVRLQFAPAGAQPLAPIAEVEEGAFEETLRATLLNYESARRWRAEPERSALQSVSASQSQPAYKLLVEQDGLYQVTHADLLAAGVAVTDVNPHTFRLTNGGQEVAIHVEGEEDDSFDAGDVLLFYGRGIDTRHTNTNVYWLTWGDGDGLRMSWVDGTPGGSAPVPTYLTATRRLEEDHNYQASRPSGPDGDRWYWDYIMAAGSPSSADYTTSLQHLAAAPYSATVRGLFRGFSADPAHHTRVYINGHLLDDAAWPPQSEYHFETSIPHSRLMELTNTISVTCGISNALDIVFVNWFEVEYRATYVAGEDLLFFSGAGGKTWEYQVSDLTTDTVDIMDITAPASPTRILSATVQPAGSVYTLAFQHAITQEHRYLALSPARRLSPMRIVLDGPSDLRSEANGADYLIITHGDFYTTVLPLADRRAAQGLRTAVVDVQDVYDEFSHGVFDPAAIRAFLAYTWSSWVRPAPAYLLLVGDGNYDPKDNLGRGETCYLPPYLADVDPWIGEVAADNRYACVSGEDILPDMHLGRLPVKTVSEAQAALAKILAYEQTPPSAGSNEQVLFVADNADQGGDFAALSDAIVDHYLVAPYTAQKVYYGVTHTTPVTARRAITQAINEGRLLVNYIGHASQQFWASEKLFRLSDVAALTNSDRLPLMVPMTCLDGYYIHPSPAGQDYSSLGEAIVQAPGRGAIASWSPTGMSVAPGHDLLNRGLFEALFLDGVLWLGPATTQAKLHLHANSGGYRDLIDTYLLFGDPALRLNVFRHTAYLPIVMRAAD